MIPATKDLGYGYWLWLADEDVPWDAAWTNAGEDVRPHFKLASVPDWLMQYNKDNQHGL